MRTCFPSIQPTQFGNLHLLQNRCLIDSTASRDVGKGMFVARNWSQIALLVSFTILPTVTSDILKEYPNCYGSEICSATDGELMLRPWSRPPVE